MSRAQVPPALRISLITGGNSGIGKETALGLARHGGTVIIVCRNKGKGEAARDEIAKKSGNQSVDLLTCDLSSLAQVRELATQVKSKYQKLHVLVNNAGLFTVGGKSADGFERTIAVNYLAPFLLTNLLLDILESSASARIVNVSSAAHYGGHIDLESLKNGGGRGGWGAYSDSKLALVLFTHELAKRLKGTGVTANSLHPGVVATGLWGGAGPLLRPFMLSSKAGAETSIFLASSPEVEGVSGEYFDDKKVKRSSDESYDEKEAAALWEISSKLVGLS